MTNPEYQPTTWAKGDRRKVARSAREAVALKFDGFKEVEQGSDLPAGDSQPSAGADADQAPSTAVVRENDDDLNTRYDA